MQSDSSLDTKIVCVRVDDISKIILHGKILNPDLNIHFYNLLDRYLNLGAVDIS